jgi:hypothetical protein
LPFKFLHGFSLPFKYLHRFSFTFISHLPLNSGISSECFRSLNARVGRQPRLSCVGGAADCGRPAEEVQIIIRSVVADLGARAKRGPGETCN